MAHFSSRRPAHRDRATRDGDSADESSGRLVASSRDDSAAAEVLPSLLTLRCATTWTLLEDIRQFVTAYVKHRFTTSVAERVSMTANELMENAIRYGSVSQEVLFDLRQSTSGHLIEVRVTNGAVASRVEMLRGRIEELEALPPEQAFEEAMRATSGQVFNRAMLGLARVRHEGQMSLEVLTEPGCVTVVARSTT